MSKNVNITIDADGSKAEKEISNVSKSLDSLDKSASKASESASKASDSIGKVGSVSAKTVAVGATLGTLIGNVLSKAFSALSSEVDAAVQRLDTLNNFPRVMANMKVSSEDADKSIAILSEKLKGLPTSLDDAALSVQRFTAANGNIKASTAMFLSLNNAILAGGASMQLQRTALEQMSQAYTKGRADAMEWRALLQAMPAQMNQIAQAMGYTSSALGGDLHTALLNGEVSMNDFMATIVRLNREGVNGFASFAEQASASTNGVGTSITNLKLAIQRGLADIMNAIGQANIAGFFNGIANAISTVTSYVVAFVKVLVAAVNAIRSLFGAGKGAKQTSNAVADAGVSAGSLANNATDAGGALDGANKSAKQLKKTLAGFDEMTVIQEPQQASGGGGGGAGGGGIGDIGSIDFGDLWGEISVGGDKAQEIADKIINAFKRAFDVISKTKAWDSLTKAMTKVGNAIKTNWSRTFDSIGSVVSNALKFARNTVEKFAPQFDSAFSHYFDGMGNYWEARINMMWAPLNSFLSGFSNQFEEVGQSISDNLGIIVITLTETTATLYDQMANLTNVITESFAPGFEVLGELMANVMNDWLASMAEWLPIISENFTGFFTELNEGLFIPMAQTLGTVWQSLCQTLSNWWNDYGKRILNAVADWFNGILSWFRKLWTDVLEPVVKPFLVEFTRVWEQSIAPALKAVMDFIGKLIAGCIEIDNKFIRPIRNFLFDVLKPAFVTVFSIIGGVVNTVFQGIGDAVNWLFTILGGIVDFITGVFTLDWTKAWEGVKTVFTTIADGIGNAFKAPINFIIDIINGFIDGINAIKIPDWVPLIGGAGFHIDHIPKLAKGGVVEGATLAMIGEAGREAVLPLDNNTGWVTDLAQQIANNGGAGATQIIVKLGEETIMDKIIEGVNEKSMLSGRNAIAV